MKSSFMNEEITLQKSDGSFSKKLSAIISISTVIAEDAGIEIEPGDIVTRTKRNGVTESYIVINSDRKTLTDGPPIYQIKVQLIDSQLN